LLQVTAGAVHGTSSPAIATTDLTRYTADMGVRCRTLLGTLLAAATLHAAAGELAMGGGVSPYYGVPLARGMYHPWFSCTPPYRCRDPVQLRLELERDRRMQELRERATQPEPRIYGPGDGPWGLQRYIPPATPEANIQPAYRGASQLRPEYERSTQPSGEPATESLK
jgi:hypothetical protein